MGFEVIFTFVISLILLGLFIRYADQLGFVDIPDFRSSHKRATPSGSGIAFFVAAILVSLFTDVGIYHNYILTVIAALMVFSLGVYDDLKNLHARYKLYIIAVAAILSFLDGFVITGAGTYFGYTIPFLWLSLPITVFAVVGFTNALNLIDGLDGLAGSICIIILSSLWFIGYQNNDYLLMGVTSIIIPALLAFLVFNWNPAKAFMGDSGSLTLGFLISILGIRALDYVSPVVILYLVAFPLIDTLVIITKRKKYGQPIFSPDKNHAHHVFLNVFNGNVKKTVLLIAFLQIAYTLFGITLVTVLPQELSLLLLLLSIVSWYYVLTRLCINHPKLMNERYLTKSNNAAVK